MELNIVDTLISQHSQLKKILGKVKKETEKESPDFTTIFSKLNQFKRFLVEHLDLENNIYYPNLFTKYAKREEETENIKKFKSDMDELAKDIEDFDSKYTYKQKIENNFGDFKRELDFIISSLQIRVSSEEKGLFLL